MIDKFSQKNSWQVLYELPDDKLAIQFPRNPKDYSKDYTIRVIPNYGHEWIGNFHGIDDHYFSGVLPWPNNNYLCVVSRGIAYVVRGDDPDTYEELPIVPITDVHIIIDPLTIIFVTFTNITAYGENGFLWTTDRLAIDGIEIKEISNGIIFGVSNNIDRKDSFTIEIKTGKSL